MKKALMLLTTLLLLSACASNSEYEGDYLDTTTSPEALNDNWIHDRRVTPFYPLEAASDKVTGCVLFSFIIDDAGRPRNIEVIDSYPKGVFEREATIALSKWRWKPLKSGSVQPVATTLQLGFNIDSVDDPITEKACAELGD